MDNELIVTIEQNFKLYKVPYQIGDIIDYEKKDFLIIGIEYARLVGANLKVAYTCQNLHLAHCYPSRGVIHSADNKKEFYLDFDAKKILESDPWGNRRGYLLPIGQVFYNKGNYYRWLNYSRIEFEFTTLRAFGHAEAVQVTPVKNIKKILLDHKKEKLGISLIKE